MQTVTLSIPGEFWDSQIYSGKLYLFHVDHSIHVYDWARAVDALIGKFPKLQTGIRVAFVDGQMLYSPPGKMLAKDEEIKNVIANQFNTLAAQKDLTIDAGKYLTICDNPFSYPHADSEIYYHKLYVGMDEGLFSVSTGSISPKLNSSADQHWDASVFSVKASHQYTTLACAAGDEGLREISVLTDDKSRFSGAVVPKLIARNKCNACDWSYQSVFGWASGEAGFLASFKKEKLGDHKYQRLPDRVIQSTELFPGGGVAWGAKDKLYSFKDGDLSVKSYNPSLATSESKGVSGKKSIPEKQFGSLGVHSVKMGDGSGLRTSDDIVSTATAPFGSIVETHDGIQIIKSDETLEFVRGEPVNWRVFPRSENYANQLHIIYEDRVEIRTYVHDYFIDQSKKWAGTVR